MFFEKSGQQNIGALILKLGRGTYCMLVYNSLILLSINQSITCILIVAVTLRKLLSSNKVEKEMKRK